ncbi:MAG: protein translocase subunit SecF [Clostridia bacterium]|nr:protein translocase subunit SecF [Clostridia bacterium]
MNKVFDYTANKIKFLLLPIVIIVLGIVMYFVHGGFNFDVEFVGGIRIQVDVEGDYTSKDISDIIKDATGLDATVQSSPASDTVVIKLPATNDEDGGEANKDKVLSALAEKYTIDENAVEVQSASASFGKEVQTKALTYTLFAILCILIYIIIRFEWRSGVMAVIALAINVLVMAAVYTITNIALNTTFIAAMLTVVGYSINNTIVIFDRIRENLKSRKRTESIREMTNRSITETLGRTINSTITTLITVVLIYILGVNTIKQFALPLIIGIVIGAYTSIFIASTFWADWKESDAKAKAQAAAERRAANKKKK